MKKQSRRTFIHTGIKTSIAIPLIGTSLLSCNNLKSKSAKKGLPNKKLNLLILGGTSFLGPHQIAYALSRGHNITTFTRGKTKPLIHASLFSQVEQLIGDRENDLSALEGRTWDAVIDNSGRNVEWTKKSAELLKDKVNLYLYTSSTGVYFPYLKGDITEDTKLVTQMPPGIEDEILKMEYGYGVMKSNSEAAAKAAFGEDRTIIVRPTYMIGPGDTTDRFIRWPIRLSTGGEVMIPGKEDDAIQYADGRDVAAWAIRLIEENNTGTFNAAGPKKAQGIKSFIKEAAKAFDVSHEFIQVHDYEFLKDQKVYYLVPWIMPETENYGSAMVNNKKALANGLTFRPLKETVADMHAWWQSDAITSERREKVLKDPFAALESEALILARWKKMKTK